MKTLILVCLSLLLVGCHVTPDCYYHDNQEKRRENFDNCMKLLPAGPETTRYNDWDEVVATCDIISHNQAKEWKCKSSSSLTNK